jgi:hypothetical protein
MSKARQLAQKTNQAGRKNLIINGAMNVAQRGTSEGPSSLSEVLALDRWYVNASGATKTISQQTFTVGQTDVPDFPKNYVRLEVTTGDNNIGIHQRVEDVTSIAGKTVTLSFWAKGTNPTGGSFVSSWIQNFGSGGSSSVETEAKSGIVLTSSWQKFTITFTVPSVAGKTIGAGSYTWVELLRQPPADTGTGAWTADIALVQLEVGTVATEFEHRSYGEELALCQRYYHTTDHLGGSTGHAAHILGVFTTTRGFFALDVPVAMRATPSISMVGSIVLRTPSLTVEGTLSSASYYANLNNTRFVLDTAFSTSTANTFREISIGTNGAFLFDAEL